MVIKPADPKRLGIYFFYDAQSVADEYVFYYLDGIRPLVRDFVIVCNGQVEGGALARLEQYGTVLVRENRGLDVGAYKAALEHVGYDRLGQYDELLLMNATAYGPLYPLSEMFGAMDGRDLDFWGVTSHGAVNWNPYPRNGLKTMPEHIQSYFLAVRGRMLRDPAFRTFWDGLPEIRSYEDSVSLFESVFTRHFADLGFTWATYTGTETMAGISPQLLMDATEELVRERRCPFIKRRSFFQDYGMLLQNTNGDQGRRALDYIRRTLDYPADLIWQNLLRTCDHTVLREHLQLVNILPETCEAATPALPRVALWMHIYYVELAEECLDYAAAMPDEADIILTTDTAEKKAKLEAMGAALPQRVRVILVENRGRDVSALLVGCAPFWRDYDVVCFAHDKKMGHLPYEVQGRTFSERCYRNTLAGKGFVRNVIGAFQAQPRLGILCPPPPNTSVYYNTIGVSDWGPNFEHTKALYDRLGLTVPISREHAPVGPYGTVFWFRPQALAPLFTAGWNYEDFPAEPQAHDGTFIHAVERIYPYAAQQAGYYSAWVLSADFAALELTNYHYMLRELNMRLIPACDSVDFTDLRAWAERMSPGFLRGAYLSVKRFLKRHLTAEQFSRLQSVKKFFWK